MNDDAKSFRGAMNRGAMNRPLSKRIDAPCTVWPVLRRGALTASLLCMLLCELSKADSVMDLLSGFDSQRIEACYPLSDTDAAGEMSKLLYRLRKADARVLSQRCESLDAREDSSSLQIGDAWKVAGTIVRIRQYTVPEKLVEFLELEKFQEAVLQQPDGTTISVFAPPVIGSVAKGDTIKADAMVIHQSASETVFAAGRLAWFPKAAKKAGWTLLAKHSVDLSMLAEAGARSRRKLIAEDGDVFYGMIAAAEQIRLESASADGTSPPPPLEIEPLDLLRSPKQYRGEWVRLRLNTVRVTRINITDLDRAAALGQDYYYQIDASGDLGDTVVELARGEGETGDPIRISGIYPLSLVSASLPPALSERMNRDSAVVVMASQAVQVDAFFYRLWSYSNEFMSQQGGGKQVGPLLVVSRWKSLPSDQEPEAGIAYLGYALAAGIVLAIAATIWWNQRNSREDERIRRKQRGEEVIGPLGE